MNDNIYIKTLEIGMKQNEGVSFNEIVKRLNINLSDIDFEVNLSIWFYSNFYNSSVESLIVGQLTASNSDYRINPRNLKDKVRPHNDKKSFIKGDAVNKYIDYLELDRTRKSSRTAKVFSILSIILASIAVIVPVIMNRPFESPQKVIIVNPNQNKPQIYRIQNSDDLIISDSPIIVNDSVKKDK
jgi:hypothetical protein